MATTQQGAAVLEQHRQAQMTLASRTIATALVLWPLLVDSQGESSGGERQTRWLQTLIALIRRDKTASAALARAYYGAYRVVELGRDLEPFEFKPDVEFNEEQVINSLLHTGPYALERARQVADVERLPQSHPRVERILTTHVGAVQRHVQNGAREVVDDVIRRDPQRKGYMRLTDGDPCYFCAMLASRGPVYDDDSFEESDPRFQGPGDHKVHDSCGCSLVPIYGPPVAMAGFKAYDALWQETTRNASGKGAILAFRRAYEEQRRSRPAS